ncbi:hypothetical protein AB0I53_24600 [Saccharopolyspora sp. NPDC050389]|uniref:hypothetical protein n=1 Tax=Saccharopolyspora sp. NPDC050389 TaxID=3155516 RepID=UPI0034114A49
MGAEPEVDEPPPVFSVSEVMAAARAGQPVVVVGEELVGMAVAQAQGERAWVQLVALPSRLMADRDVPPASLVQAGPAPGRDRRR